MCKKHILIIDDDDRIRELLKKFLLKNNFLVSSVENVKKAKEILQNYIFDILIVDYMLPDESGIDLISNLRQNNVLTPIIMLTALNEVENRIKGLSVGSDDYISKPFEPQELVLRINNIFKRQKTEENKNIVNFDEYCYNLEKKELIKNNQIIKLTDNEINLLQIFCTKINTVISREELCFLTKEINERNIDVQILRLRKKIENNVKNPKFLKTVRNKGYIFKI